jgi:hypothetical protein
MRDILHNLRDDRSVGVVAFTGAGEKAFVAGADIGELRQRTILDGLTAKLQRLYDDIESVEKPGSLQSTDTRSAVWLRARHGLRHPRSSENARFGLPGISLSAPMASIAKMYNA